VNGRSAYATHITVGLSWGVFPGSVVFEKISFSPKDPCKITIDRITFATYQVWDTSGALTGRFEVALQPA
jgi:hypothetical protein